MESELGRALLADEGRIIPMAIPTVLLVNGDDKFNCKNGENT